MKPNSPSKKKVPAQKVKKNPGTTAFAHTFIDMYKSMFIAMQEEYGEEDMEKMAAIAVQVRDVEADDFATMFAGTERQLFKLASNLVSYLVHVVKKRNGTNLSTPDLANQVCRDIALSIVQAWAASNFNHSKPPDLSPTPPNPNGH